MSTSRILVAVSSPWASERLAESVIDLATRLRAEVVAVHVAHVREEDEHESDAAKRGEQTLSLLSGQLTEVGLAVEPVLLYSDDIALAILNTAHARQCTLIVMGTSGQSGVKWWLRRNVPARVVKQTDLPVMLCPGQWGGTV